MIKKATAFFTALALMLAFAGCGSINTEGGGRLKVLVSFNAMKEFVLAVGQDKVSVSSIVPDGMEAHDFEPKARDLALLGEASVFVYNGLGMEPWAKNAVSSANNARLIAVEASHGAEIVYFDHDHDAHEEEDGHGHGHGEDGADPHVWLSLTGAIVEVQNIAAALAEADPVNKAFYEQNGAAYAEQLEALHREYAPKFEALANKSFVTGHAAFAYLCRDFGLTQVSVADVFNSGEPSPRQMAELVEFCRQNGVTAIFAEKASSAEVSKTLANEVNAEVKPIYTMENAEDEKSYLTRMEDNLREIYESLTVRP